MSYFHKLSLCVLKEIVHAKGAKKTRRTQAFYIFFANMAGLGVLCVDDYIHSK